MKKAFTFVLAGIFALGTVLSLTGCSKGGNDEPTPADKTVSVAAQQGTITAGTAGEATFAVTTANIADGKGGSVTWYSNPAGTTTASAPAGIAPSVTDVASNAATVTMTATSAAREGTYYFKVAIDGTVSGTAALTVSPEAGENNGLNGTTWVAMQFDEWLGILSFTLEFTSDTAVNMTVTGEDLSIAFPNGTYTYTPPTALFSFPVTNDEQRAAVGLEEGETELRVGLDVSDNRMGDDNDDGPIFLKQTGDASQEYFIIVIDDDGHGYGDGWADKHMVTAGETVSLNATPDSGFEFDKWTVLMGDITLSPDANTSNATFTMPSSTVVVRAEFVREGLGTTIGGITWATRNVDAPGTFAAAPEDYGMFYQWGKNVGWSVIDPLVSSNGDTTWDTTDYDGEEWLAANDPCPEGWRVPTNDEFESLCHVGYVNSEWRDQNGVPGRLFTDRATETKSIFIPAAGFRGGSDGLVYYQGMGGYYWSSTPSSSYGCSLRFYSDSVGPSVYYNRSYGLSVRCVRK